MGFADLLETMAVILGISTIHINIRHFILIDLLFVIAERECTLLPHSAHPDCAMQLAHAASQLRLSRDVRHVINALRTKFTHDD